MRRINKIIYHAKIGKGNQHREERRKTKKVGIRA